MTSATLTLTHTLDTTGLISPFRSDEVVEHVKRKRSNSAWALHVRSYPRMHIRSYPRLGTGFSLSAHRAYTPEDEFGSRESIFWAIVRP